MLELIKKIPFPFAGVMLGSAALGNLLQSYSEGFRTFFGVVAFAILLLLTLKIIIFPNAIAEDMKNTFIFLSSFFPHVLLKTLAILLLFLTP